MQIAETPGEGELVILRSASDEESLAYFFEILRRVPLLRMTTHSSSALRETADASFPSRRRPWTGDS